MKRKHIALVALILCFSFSLLAQSSSESNIQQIGEKNSDGKPTFSLNSMVYSLKNLYSYLDTNFLYDIDNEEMQYELVEAMVNSLGDRFSYFIRPESAQQFDENTKGEYVGIGTYLTKANPAYKDYEKPESYMVIITSPFPGGPADRAGLKAKDMISAVNGEAIDDLNATEASKLIRGKEGEPITLTVHRGDSVFDITLIPEVVITPTSEVQMLDGNIGYIRILQFSQTTFETIYNDVKKIFEDGATSLIIDLRNNGGGVVDSALSIANMFVSDGTLLTIGYKQGSPNQNTVYKATNFLAVPESVPIVLLINGGTASASEILAAALKENGRATLVGSKSFGKGIMQHVIPYLDGFLNITVAHYYTPNGNDIHEIGIIPDYIVEDEDYTDDELASYADFVKNNKTKEWIEKYPDYSKENIEAFALDNEDSGVPYSLLCLLMRNEYIYALDYDKRPVADPIFDLQLKKAIEVINDSL